MSLVKTVFVSVSGIEEIFPFDAAVALRTKTTYCISIRRDQEDKEITFIEETNMNVQHNIFWLDSE